MGEGFLFKVFSLWSAVCGLPFKKALPF